MMTECLRPGILNGRTVFVTGGGSGINLAIGKALGALGAAVGICGRSPERLEEGVRQLEATGAKAFRDGWYATGDAGVRDAGGLVTIVDRTRDMMISGGENVYPSEVEAALAGHDAIAAVAVVGALDARWGHRIVAAIVAKEGCEPPALDALRRHLDPLAVEDVILGCVMQAGEQCYAFPRNAILAPRLPATTPGVAVDHQCGSSQQSLQFAAQAVMSGTQDVVIAAGVQSMTRVPMFSSYTLHEKVGIGTGPLSQKVKDRYHRAGQFSQFEGAETLDRFALGSHQRAAAAIAVGAFDDEIVPIDVDGMPYLIDEGVRADATLEAIASVKLLSEDGVISAANASQICDGASGALVLSARGPAIWPDADRAHPQPDRHRRRPGHHAGGADHRDAPRARPCRHEDR